MLSAIEYSVKHFCVDILGYELQKGKTLGKDYYGASIPIFKNGVEYSFYLYFKKETLNSFGKALLNNDKLPEDDLCDICKEVANQIIGYAKNLLVDRGKDEYKLGTPEYLGMTKNFGVRLNEKIIFKMNNRTFQIGYKKV
ncbi:Mrr restriction system protein (EcoKMrr) [Campylobacter sputorum subsp. bubulus]|uniref:Mrr restriction system protein (EcoKMrr) n=1 Tax=Campylobacter sputorum subsp. sputorum TaxID=32024 RepID=A0A381DKR8_9BACT|nr:restriction endonuclease [Campylobacter sputorum]ASM34562.1 hypothetical protein CSPUT_0302 [Campylobacter sputorum aubsp. sputorum RM3237]KAB0580785.1 chemotaxis protein CheX [Campylobacter sputorum subsp. sputorum]QEL04752.1 hypothetical protein CSPT_0302 [Campylobacter sputorum subsp. sputorum]SUX09675.1 Mrr restriction system protein (EcoKMrr) [Campylobacter sputorum subsp. bubulus]SUX11235.1 Mrr restriction system protein (EcoKMrr) [Campylobacter sputorum subsp. sputorum]